MLRLVVAPDTEKHLCDGLIGSPVERPLQRPDGRGNGRMQIRHRRGGDAGREGGGIEFMLGIERERHVEYVGHCGCRLIIVSSDR